MTKKMTLMGVGDKPVEITPLDDSFTYTAVGEIDMLVLFFESPDYVELKVGAEVEVRGRKYQLMKPEDLTMYHTQYYSYRATMYGAGERAKLYKVQNPIDGRLEFTLTAKPHEHMQMLVDILKAREPNVQWQAGNVPERAEVMVAYNHTTVLGGLQQLAEVLGTEWSIEDTTLHVGELQAGGDPLSLGYGEGKGIRPDVKRLAGDDYPVRRMYVQTSDRNINPKTYGASRLTLPKSKTGSNYQTDAKGTYVELTGLKGSYRDESLDLQHVYPMREGVVSSVVVTEQGQVDFVDTSIPDALDYGACQIAGETMSVVFQSGMLAGRDGFAVHRYDHKTRTFQLVQRDEDGVVLPSGAFVPKAGDRYAVFGCALPDAYLRDAEERALQEALKVLAKESKDQFETRAEVDGIWAKKNWNTIGHKLVLGGAVLLSDPKWLPTPTQLRITGIKTYLGSPYSPELELGNKVTSSTLSSLIRKVEAEPTIRRAETKREVQRLSERMARDVFETKKLIENIKLPDFEQPIKPKTLQTMQAIVGSRLLQFEFVRERKANAEVVPFKYYHNKGGTELEIPKQYLRQLKGSERDANTLSTGEERVFVWPVSGTTWSYKESDPTLFIYANLREERFEVTAEERDVNEYMLLVALVTGKAGAKQVTTLYGFTEILPGQLQTNLIRSRDGRSFWDLVSGKLQTKSEFVVGDPASDTCLAYIAGTLYLKGALVALGNQAKTIEEILREQYEKQEEEAKAREEAIRKEREARQREIEAINANPPRINEKGNWEVYRFLNGVGGYVDTGRTAQGDDGKAPKIVDGYWYEWDASKGRYTNTGVKAQGQDGQDGEGRYVGYAQKLHWSYAYTNSDGRFLYAQNGDVVCMSTNGSTNWNNGVLQVDWKRGEFFMANTKVEPYWHRVTGRDGAKGERGEKGDPGEGADPKEMKSIKAGLANANTLIKSLENATKQLEAGVLTKADTEDIQYLLQALQKGRTQVKGGLVLTNNIILSDPSSDVVTAELSGNGKGGHKALRLGIKHKWTEPETTFDTLSNAEWMEFKAQTNDTKRREWLTSHGFTIVSSSGRPEDWRVKYQQQVGEETALSNDGKGHIGRLHFGGEDIRFGDSENHYMQIGGKTRSESQMVNSSTEVVETSLQGAGTNQNGNTLVHSFTALSGVVRYTCDLRVWASCQRIPRRYDGGGATPDWGQGGGSPQEYYGNSSSTTAYLKMEVWRNGSLAWSTKSDTIEVKARIDGSSSIPGEVIIDKGGDHQTASGERTLTASSYYVRSGDEVRLYLSCSCSMGEYNGGGAGVSQLKLRKSQDTSRPMVSVSSDRSAFFYGREKYVLFNYIREAVLKVVGGMIVEGDLKVTGSINGSKGGFYAGGVINTYGDMQRWVGRKLTVRKIHNGKYEITHNVGHLNYSIVAIPINSDDWNAFVVRGSETSYSVQIGVMWSSGWRDGAIHFAFFAQ